jgi:hypothetical protein
MVLIRLLLLSVYVVLACCSDGGAETAHFNVDGYYSHLSSAMDEVKNYLSQGRIRHSLRSFERVHAIKKKFDDSFSGRILEEWN